MTYRIQRAVVIGSGTMGGGIAAHLANAGIRTVLLDIVPNTLTPEEEAKGLSLQTKAVRNRVVQTGWDRVVKSSPAALMNKKAGELVQLGNLEDDFAVISEADWVIEVIVEKLEPKQQLMARIDEIRKAGSIISSNTSGIPIHKIAEGRSEDFKKHFLGTHFFNPPRYLKLLEVIPTPDTDSAIIEYIRSFGQERLGKGVVIAKDTPNFIANRIGTFGGAYAMKYIVDNGYSIEEVDALTGTLIGNPKSGTFRLGDLVGIDVMVGVAHNLYNLVPDDESRDALLAPAPVKGLLERGWLGQKSGQGFYKTVKGANGKEFWVLDWETGEHRAPREVDLPIIKQAKKQGNLAARLRFLVNQSQDRGGKLIADTLLPSLAYAARRVPEISDHLYDVDNALRWGFAKELGPFEMWDAIGIADGVKLMQERDIQVADWVLELLEKGNNSFYQKVDGANQAYSPVTGEYEAVPSSALKIELDELRSTGKEVARNDSASLIDLGDGVLCFEFHSKMNALDSEITEMGFKALELLKDDRWTGMVVGNQGSDFCIGANIFMLMMAAQNDQFDQLEQMLKTSHDLMQGMRFSPKPIVTAPFGRVLGGGAEVSMHGSRMCIAAETYMGLVEVGVGLIPGAGGVKEFVRRVITPAIKLAPESDPTPYLQRVFEQIGMAKVGTSAFEARDQGFVTEADRIVMNGDELLGRAKQFVLDLAAAGFTPPAREKLYAAGRDGLAAMRVGVWMMQQGGYISEYDALIGNKLAYAIAGGDLSSPQWVDEEHFLAMEREVFLALCHEPKTMERIMFMLQNNKPLRN